MSTLDFIQRANPDYVENLYRRYLEDPTSVDAQWGLFFAGFELAPPGWSPIA